MTKLEELLKEYCPNGVKYADLSTIVKVVKGMQLNKEKLLEKGLYPVINGGISPSGYWNEYNFDENLITISQGGASAGFVNWQKTKFWAGAHCYVLLNIAPETLHYRFLFHVIKMYEKKLTECQYGAGIPALAAKTVNDLQIPLPALPVQREIVRVLDGFTLYSQELTAELTARCKQYEYYRDKLLTPKTKKIFSAKLGEIAEIYDGTHQTPEYKTEGIPFISVENINDIYSTNKYISVSAFEQYKVKPKVNDVFMTRIGSIGKCAVMTKQVAMAFYVSLALIRPKPEILNSQFLKYYIESIAGQKELSKRTLHNAVPIKVNKDDIGKIMVSYPSLEVQERIVEVLDNFDKICSDLKIGLPAEIEKRQKQYEFYRDKLLTFDNESATIFTDRQTDRQTDRPD